MYTFFCLICFLGSLTGFIYGCVEEGNLYWIFGSNSNTYNSKKILGLPFKKDLKLFTEKFNSLSLLLKK